MRIAIVKLSSLGDIVHAMVVLQYIKKLNSEISIDWIVEEGFKDLLNFHPHINKLHLVNFRNAKKKKSILMVFKELKKLRSLDRYDIVIDMQGLIKSALISKLIPSKKTIGFDKFSIREKMASIFYDKRFSMRYDENIIKRNFELIKFALNLPFHNNDIHSKLPFLFPSHKYTFPNISNIKKNILLIPGASHTSKRYPAESFSKLTYLLDANYLVLWGDSDEELIAKEIKNFAPEVNICEKLSIEELTSLTTQVDLVIGSDTGPTHIAWAVNTPSITLFGSTPGYRNTFIADINGILESNSKVDPYKINKNDYSIKDIELGDIVKMSHTLLNLSQ